MVIRDVGSFPVRICPTDGFFLAGILRGSMVQYVVSQHSWSASPSSGTSVSLLFLAQASCVVYLGQCEKGLLKTGDYHVASTPS